jgi:hypothetical protein
LVLLLPSLFNRFKIKPPSFAFNSPVVDQVTTLPPPNMVKSPLPLTPGNRGDIVFNGAGAANHVVNTAKYGNTNFTGGGGGNIIDHSTNGNISFGVSLCYAPQCRLRNKYCLYLHCW